MSNQIISNRDDIVCQLLDWYTYDDVNIDIDSEQDIEDYDDLDNRKYVIRIFGKTEDGKSVSIKVLDFKPFFYVELPKKWTEVEVSFLIDKIKKKIGKKFSNSITTKVIKKLKFRGFNNRKKFKFIKFSFKNSYVMRRCRYLFDKKISLPELFEKKFKLNLFESNILPFLRFIHIRNIKPAGWIYIENNSITSILEDDKETRCDIEISCHWKNVYPVDKDDISPLIISSYDIEADSSHGDFPLAKKTYQKLAYDIVYKLYDIKRNSTKNKLNINNREFTSIKDIDNFANTQSEFEILCKSHLNIILKVMVMKGFYDNIEEMCDLNYSLEFLLGDISNVFTKKNKKPRMNIVEHTIKEAQIIIPYINLKNNTKENKKFKDCIKDLKTKYIKYDLETLIKKIKAISYCDDGKNSIKDVPYYYKDLLSKLVNRTYLVKELDRILTQYFPAVKGDKVIQIGTTSNRYGSKECFLKHIITLKSCEPIEGCVVESYETEREVLLAWVDFINELLPDILLGYNIFGFDFAYLYHRAEELGIAEEFSMIGKLLDKPSVLINKQLSSSALGHNDMYYMDMTGIVLIDLLKVVRGGHNLSSYKLDDVAKHFIGSQKDNVSPKDIFRLQKQGSKERMIVAKYCIQDCVLCNDLASKLDVVSNNVGMANVCSVPLSYIFLRGQGIKIFSLVAKECRENGYLLPVLEKIGEKKSKKKRKQSEEDNDCSFEGAIVLDPKPGIYFDPIAVLDYSSLYPSSIISENLSHETYCTDKQWLGKSGIQQLKLLGLDYVDISFNQYKDVDPNNKNKGKIKVGEKTCRFVQYPNDKYGNEQKGIIPNILKKLLTARKTTRAKIKTEKDEFKKAVLDGLQLAYKITANSLYGQIGAKTSNIRWIDIADCTTAVGRNLVMFAKNTVEKEIEGTEVVYGDSVTGDTPILLKNINNNIEIKTIEVLGDIWNSYENFKPWDKSLNNKEQSYSNYRVWCNNKWSKIKRVIRHKTNKKIYRINTHCGVVDVTEDHSLLNKEGVIIKPNNCIINETELLHSYPKMKNTKPPNLIDIIDILDKYDSIDRNDAEKKAFIYGMFYGDGSCGYYNCPSGNKYSWAINNQDLKLLEMCKKYLKDLYGNKTDFKILETIESSGVRKLIPKGNIKYMVNKFLPLFYNRKKYKTIPNEILNDNYNIRLNFFIGYYFADGSKERNSKIKHINFSNKGKIGSAQLYYLTKSLGYLSSISIRNDKKDIYRIRCCIGDCFRSQLRKIPNIIKKIELIGETNNEQYVYDLETEDGIFQAGVGEIIVKNTDSVFVKFRTVDKNGKKLSGLEAVQKSIDVGLEFEKIVKNMLKPPHNLEYEKTFWPFVLLSKKRYVGNKYEFNTKKYKQTSMGIVLKRRDNADIVKDIYGGVIDIIINKKNIEESKDFLRKSLMKLINGNYPLEKLVITKSLRAGYKDPQSIAHKVLADRMGERDPGNKPQVNDRIPFVYISVPEKKGKKILQGNRIEHPQYIKNHKLKPDYKFYITNQIMKPVAQVFDLVMENPESLFNESLRIATNRKNNVQEITRWFKPKK